MKRRKIIFFSAFVLNAFTSTSLAEQFQQDSLDHITETAFKICNTIKESKGTMNKTQIQGGVEAELKGLIGKLADLKGSGKIDFNKEEFEGLSREATATALEGDRGCRERLFNKMHDNLESPVDKATKYMKDGRRTDLRTVQDYIRVTPITEIRVGKNYVCSDSDVRHSSKISIENNQLSIANWTETNQDRCDSPKLSKGENTLQCKADMDKLDDLIWISSSPSLIINCLTGDCVNCYETSRYKIKNQDWIDNESRNYKINNLTVYVGEVEYIRNNEEAFYGFARALARLISGGSDEAFCKYVASHYTCL